MNFDEIWLECLAQKKAKLDNSLLVKDIPLVIRQMYLNRLLRVVGQLHKTKKKNIAFLAEFFNHPMKDYSDLYYPEIVAFIHMCYMDKGVKQINPLVLDWLQNKK